MTEIDYLLIGNITADIGPQSRLLGGTVSYSSRTAAAFGLRVGLVTSAADGEPLLEQLRPDASIALKPAAHTTTFENIYTPSGRVQYIRAAAGLLGKSDIPDAWRDVPVVHLGPIAGELDPGIASVFPEAMVLLTLQGCLRRWGDDGRVRFRRWFDQDVLRHIQIVVFSEEDILEAPELEAEFAAAVRCLVVTRAERGGTLYLRGERFEYTSPQVSLVHPTGAGDIFAAALLASLRLVDGDYLAACHMAARLAATSVTRVGLESTPTRDEVRLALESFTAERDGR